MEEKELEHTLKSLSASQMVRRAEIDALVDLLEALDQKFSANPAAEGIGGLSVTALFLNLKTKYLKEGLEDLENDSPADAARLSQLIDAANKRIGQKDLHEQDDEPSK